MLSGLSVGIDMVVLRFVASQYE